MSKDDADRVGTAAQGVVATLLAEEHERLADDKNMVDRDVLRDAVYARLDGAVPRLTIGVQISRQRGLSVYEHLKAPRT